MNCKITKKIFAAFVCATLIQTNIAGIAYADNFLDVPNNSINCKFDMDFSQYDEGTDLGALGITKNATKETFDKTDDTEYLSGSDAQIVYDEAIGQNVLEFNPHNFAETKIGENLDFELKDKLYKENGPFTVSIRYNTPEVIKHSNGTLNMIGFDSDGNRKILYFGDITYLANTDQRKYRRLMIGNSLWTSNSTLKPTAYLTMSDMSKTVNKYITYKYVVDPASETFKFYYKPDDSEKWVEPYASYELPTGPIPDVVTQFRFSLYENDGSKLNEDARYKIAAINVSQGLELESSEPENGGKLKGKVIKLHFNSAIDEDSIGGDSISVKKDNRLLAYGEDYTARLNDESNDIEIVLNELPSGFEKYTVCINDRINSVNSGYAKLDSGEIISVNLSGAIDEGYINYKETYDNAPQGLLTDFKDGTYTYAKELYYASQGGEIGEATVDTTKDGETALKYKANIDAAGKGEYLSINFPEPIETSKGNVKISFSLYGEQPNYSFATQFRGYNSNNAGTVVKADTGIVAYSNDGIRYPDGAMMYTADNLKLGWYDLSYEYNSLQNTMTVRHKESSGTSWTEKTFKLNDSQKLPDFLRTLTFKIFANNNIKTFGVDGIYWIDNVEAEQTFAPTLVQSTIKDGDVDVDNYINSISLEYNMAITESSANQDTVKLMEADGGELKEVSDINVSGNNNSDGTKGVVDINILSSLKPNTKYLLQTEGIEAKTVKRGKSDKTLIYFTTAQNYILTGNMVKDDKITINAQVKANSKFAAGKSYVIFAALIRNSDGAIIKFDFDENLVSAGDSVYSEYNKTFVFDKPQDLADDEYSVTLRLLNGFVKTYSLAPKLILK